MIDGTHQEHMKDPTFFHLLGLRTYHQDHSLPLKFHLQQLGEHLERAPFKDSARIDNLLWNTIEDMAVVYDVLTALQLHRPRSTTPAGMTTPMGECHLSARTPVD